VGIHISQEKATEPDPATAHRTIPEIIEDLDQAIVITTLATMELDLVSRPRKGKSAVTTPLGKDHNRKDQMADQITQEEKSARQSIPEIMAW
jgi:hypothetical protein